MKHLNTSFIHCETISKKKKIEIKKKVIQVPSLKTFKLFTLDKRKNTEENFLFQTEQTSIFQVIQRNLEGSNRKTLIEYKKL